MHRSRATIAEAPAIHEPLVASPRGYVIVGRVGQGSFGTVYAARQLSVRRLVAIKVLGAGHEASTAAREAEALATLRHPHVAPVIDLVRSDGRWLLVMPLFEGGTLDGLLRERGPLTASEVIGLLRPLADALDDVHRHGLLHRDIKPANLFLDRDGRPALGDFGLAAAQHAAAPDRRTWVEGSLAYLSPELRAGAPPTPASDVYALGAAMLELLTGALPDDEPRRSSRRTAGRRNAASRLLALAPACPRDLAELVDKMLDPDPRRRPVPLAPAAGSLASAATTVRPTPITIRPVVVDEAPMARRAADRLLTGLDVDEVEALKQMAAHRTYAAGEIIFREGEPGTSMHLVDTGHVIIRTDASRRPPGRAVSLLGPGDHFGELALVAPGVRMADAVALDRVATFELSASQFEELSAVHPAIERTLLTALAQSVRRLTRIANDHLLGDDLIRLLARLDDLALLVEDGRFPVPPAVLSELAGVDPETAAGLLAVLAADAVVELDHCGAVRSIQESKLADRLGRRRADLARRT